VGFRLWIDPLVTGYTVYRSQQNYQAEQIQYYSNSGVQYMEEKSSFFGNGLLLPLAGLVQYCMSSQAMLGGQWMKRAVILSDLIT
jgi:hypothetical protein